MDNKSKIERSLGLYKTTAVGVGAIVGGGILALAGVAFTAAGPSAIVAFALNGLLALLTAMSFAELATSFPESGGAYTFAKKVLSVKTAFCVGWMVWFASIAAAVLYSLGFASYAVVGLKYLWSVFGRAEPLWLSAKFVVTIIALGTVGCYTLAQLSPILCEIG